MLPNIFDPGVTKLLVAWVVKNFLPLKKKFFGNFPSSRHNLDKSLKRSFYIRGLIFSVIDQYQMTSDHISLLGLHRASLT
jgi:hypothetical protein